MKTNIKYYLVICLVGLTFIPLVLADDGSGCNDYNNTNFVNPSWGVYCYVEGLYHQNKILIQEQNQTNNLMAMQICEKNYYSVQYPDESTNGKDFTKCINRVLEATR